MKKPLFSMCAKCPVVACDPKIDVDGIPSIGSAPSYCPMIRMSDVIEKAVKEYEKSDIREFARLASVQEFEGCDYLAEGQRPKNPRILELIQFARKCNYKKLGIAFCDGLSIEARKLTEVLEKQNFQVVSVRCKVGATPKEFIGIKPNEKNRGHDKYESMCNPIAQAEVLNAEKVDLAVMLGLCIGHDTLLLKYLHVPVTVLAVKDRVTGHNPLIPLYLLDTYYKWLPNVKE